MATFIVEGQISRKLRSRAVKAGHAAVRIGDCENAFSPFVVLSVYAEELLQSTLVLRAEHAVVLLQSMPSHMHPLCDHIGLHTTLFRLSQKVSLHI